MEIYFAPLEGITGYLFRQAYENNIGGIDRYYAPFATTRDGGFMKKKEKRDLLPENNPGIRVIPQLMTNSAADFCQAACHMEEMGYREVNLNLGCPSGTVVSKGKGAGFLRKPEELDRFLEEIFRNCPIAISIKSRLGYYEVEEFPSLLDIYNRYPVRELILHLRTKEEYYGGGVHRELFRYAVENSTNPLCYNGDIGTVQDVYGLEQEFPSLRAVMIGRGFLRDPGFVRSGECGPADSRMVGEFMAQLLQAYEENLSGETPVLYKMKELWSYLKESIPEGERLFHKIKKVKHLEEYRGLAAQLW